MATTPQIPPPTRGNYDEIWANEITRRYNQLVRGNIGATNIDGGTDTNLVIEVKVVASGATSSGKYTQVNGPVTSIDLTSLDGDDAGGYTLECCFKAAQTGYGSVTVNNVTSGYKLQQLYFQNSGTSVSYSTTALNLAEAYMNSGESGLILNDIFFNAEADQVECFSRNYNTPTDHTVYVSGCRLGSQTNITSVKVTHDTASGFAAGTVVRLYRRK